MKVFLLKGRLYIYKQTNSANTILINTIVLDSCISETGSTVFPPVN